MGTNYYVVSKKTSDISKSLFKTYKRLYNSDVLNNVIKATVIKKFKRTINFLNENNLESKIELFEDRLDDAIQKFTCDIKYDVLDVLDMEEEQKVHIGKSSGGWLFGFQSQHTELDGIPIIWNTYDDIKNWLNEYVEEKQMFIIQDEYGRKISVKCFTRLVDIKQKNKTNLDNPNNFTYSRNVNGYRFNDRDFS